MSSDIRITSVLLMLLAFTVPTLGLSCNTVTEMEGGPKPYGGWWIQYPAYSGGATAPWCTMRSGASGAGVKAVQRALNRCSTQWDYEGIPKLAVDGSYGPKTISAVKYIQDVWNIKVDGIWGTDTGHAMYWEATRENDAGNIVKACKKKFY